MESKKCIVHFCENRTDQGEFQGNVCTPCYDLLEKLVVEKETELKQLKELVVYLEVEDKDAGKGWIISKGKKSIEDKNNKTIKSKEAINAAKEKDVPTYMIKMIKLFEQQQRLQKKAKKEEEVTF